MNLCKHGYDPERCGWCDEIAVADRARLTPTPETTKFSPEETKLLGVAAPQLMKLLRDREAACLGRIHSDFRAGHHEQTASIAELCTLREIQTEITNTLKRQAAQEEKRHAATKRPNGDAAHTI